MHLPFLLSNSQKSSIFSQVSSAHLAAGKSLKAKFPEMVEMECLRFYVEQV